MADQELTKLIFEVEQQGAASVEKQFGNVERSLKGALSTFQEFSSEGKKSNASLENQFMGMRSSITELEGSISSASKEWGGMFSSGKMRRQEKRLRDMKGEMDGLAKVMQAGDEDSKKAAKERFAEIKKAYAFEMAQTGKVFEKHQKEFDKLVNTEKKSLADLSGDALGGGMNAIQALRSGDVKGFAQTLGSGAKNIGEQGQKRAFDAQMKGGAGGTAGKLAGALGKFAKIAGPLAIAAGAIGTIVKLFLDLDAKVKDINKSMLKNVSLVEMASTNYTNFEDKLADSEEAMREFRNTVMTDMDLRMMGLDPEEMAGITTGLHEAGMLMGDIRDEGVSSKEMLMEVQTRALALGVDATEAAELIGTLGDVTQQSFDEAMDTMTQVISFAQEAGVSTKKFYSTVQNVVGEMGLYNYKIQETAALFSKLTNIMDAKSAEDFVQTLSTAIKNMSAVERVSMIAVNGISKVAKMAEKAQKSVEKSLDPQVIQKAFEKMGGGAEKLFDKFGFEGAMEKMTAKQKNMLDATLNRLDNKTGEKFDKYRRILEADKNNELELQGIMGDFALGDQIALQIGDLTGKLGMPLENINSVLAESQGYSEDQLRMLKSLKSSMSGDLELLRQAAAEDPESFQEMAEKMGYSVEAAELQNMNWSDLMEYMTKDKQEEMLEEQKNQKTLAEKQADMQRSMLDTLKYKMMDLVSGIYEVVLDIYSAIVDFFGGQGPEKERRVNLMKEDAETRRGLRSARETLKLAQEDGDEDSATAARERIAELEGSLRQNAAERRLLDSGMGIEDAGRSARTGIKSREEYDKHAASGKALLDQSLADGTKRFKYGDEWVDNFRGRKDKNYGKLTKVIRDGKTYEGEDLKKLLDEAIMLSQARDELDEVMKKKLDEGNVFAEDSETIQKETKAVLEEKGIMLSDKAIKKLVDRQIKAQTYKQAVSDLAADFEVSRDEAAHLVNEYQAGNKDAIKMFENNPLAKDIVDSYGIRPAKPKEAGDARIMTKGIPFLSLQPGDIVVDQESLANTVAGSKGQFVPELLKKAGASGGSSGGGGGGGNTMHANFFINGGNQSEIRRTILKVLEEWERARSMS
jgi:hypothetical protein